MRGKEETRFQGLGVSPGIVCAPIIVRDNAVEEPETYLIAGDAVEFERNRLEKALVQTRQEIVSLQDRIRNAEGPETADIFDAHLLVLEDHLVLEQVIEKVRQELINIESAVHRVFTSYMESLRSVDDPYLKERAIDLSDVLGRILRNLAPDTGIHSEAAVQHPHILLTPDLTPSEIAAIDRGEIVGIATEMGSPTSHTAIISRSLGLPAVVGLHKVIGSVHSGDKALLDGYKGALIVNPLPKTIAQSQAYEEQQRQLRQSLQELIDRDAKTADGHRIILSCNIEFTHEMAEVREVKAEGVGLYRTEFFYLDRTDLPDEESLVSDYSGVVRKAAPHSVIFRTLDTGGDKLPGTVRRQNELNPFLGWRGIRVSLEQHDLFHTQLRAILRASAHGPVSVMFPLVSSIEELRAAKKEVECAKESLRDDGIAFDEEIPVGVMIEVPSAALIADSIAKEADFFSIGTNDLVQYTIAVDRVNEQVAGLYAPHHPAIVRLIRIVAEAARNNNIWAGVCGQMAGDVLSIPLLVGLGITELSVSPGQLLPVKRALRSLRLSECESLVAEALEMATIGEISTLCHELATRCYPELLGAEVR